MHLKQISAFVVASCLAACLLGSAARSQGSASVTPLTVRRVAGNVYMLDSGTSVFKGGNVAVFSGSSGVIVVDSQSNDASGQAVFEEIGKISAKPIRYVINTHCHGDHSGGNSALQRAGATVVAHVNVRRRVEAGKCDRTEFREPFITFDTDFTLRLDGEEIRVVKLPAGHSDGDSIVYFKNANVVHTGDAFISINLPFDSKYVGGTMLGLIDELKALIDLVPADAKVIPGHGPEGTMADVRQTLSVLTSIKEAVKQEIARGAKLDDLVKQDRLKTLLESIEPKEREYYLRKLFEAQQFSF